MAFSKNTHLMLFICLVVVGFAGLGQIRAQNEICKGLNVGRLISECGPFVQLIGPKRPPSDECCTVLKGVDVPCACNHLPSGAEMFVSVDKAVYVARYCGIKLEPGSKCGKYTIPPPKILN